MKLLALANNNVQVHFQNVERTLGNLRIKFNWHSQKIRICFLIITKYV